jgi:hypothetical protein
MVNEGVPIDYKTEANYKNISSRKRNCKLILYVFIQSVSFIWIRPLTSHWFLQYRFPTVCFIQLNSYYWCYKLCLPSRYGWKCKNSSATALQMKLGSVKQAFLRVMAVGLDTMQGPRMEPVIWEEAMNLCHTCKTQQLIVLS